MSNISKETLDLLPTISYTNLKYADIYSTNDKVFVGIVDNSTFKLYEYNLNLSPKQTSPIKTITNSDFENTIMMAINDKTAYIVAHDTNETWPIMHIQNYSSNETLSASLKMNYQAIDTFYNDGQEYILTFTSENLRLLTTDCSEVSAITMNEFDEIPLDIKDIDYFNDTIYVADNNHNSIQSYKIDNTNSDEIKLKAEHIMICSSSKEIGRFTNVNNITIYNNKVITSDTDNNRIQIIDNFVSSTINSLDNNTSPKAVNTDTLGNLYFATNTSTNSKIIKYTLYDNTYTLSNSYEKVGLKTIGYISDMTIANNDILYVLDYSNNSLLYLSTNGLETKTTLPFDLTENSKIEYIKGLDVISILNNSMLYIYSTNSNIELLASIATNATDITSDIKDIYLLENNSIKLLTINISNETYSLNITKNVEDPAITNFSTVYYDIVNRQMYSFNKNRQCIEYFNLDLAENSFELYDINNKEFLTETDTIIPITFSTSPIIYQFPYGLGKAYNLDKNITNCFIIEKDEYKDYYRIIFNDNNTLQTGYIKKTDAPQNTHKNFESINLNVITIHQEVQIYKYPTLLKSNDKAITVGNIPIYTIIDIYASCPISIDGKTFYMYKTNNLIGFIFNADIVLNESSHITYLKNANATIKTFDGNNIKIYNNDKTIEIYSLDNNSRVFVENFDKNSEYTKITYKTTDLKTIEGYVLTKYIEMDNLDNSKIIIICIIIFSLILLAVIVICYFSLKKKKV